MAHVNIHAQQSVSKSLREAMKRSERLIALMCVATGVCVRQSTGWWTECTQCAHPAITCGCEIYI